MMIGMNGKEEIQQMNSKLKKMLLPFLDINDNNKIDWYEWLIPLAMILFIEIMADFIAQFVFMWVTS